MTDDDYAPMPSQLRRSRDKHPGPAMRQRFPVEPLIAACVPLWCEQSYEGQPGGGHNISDVVRASQVLGMSERQLWRWHAAGTISALQADRAATTIGLHPGEIWPEWWSPPVD